MNSYKLKNPEFEPFTNTNFNVEYPDLTEEDLRLLELFRERGFLSFKEDGSSSYGSYPCPMGLFREAVELRRLLGSSILDAENIGEEKGYKNPIKVKYSDKLQILTDKCRQVESNLRANKNLEAVSRQMRQKIVIVCNHAGSIIFARKWDCGNTEEAINFRHSISIIGMTRTCIFPDVEAVNSNRESLAKSNDVMANTGILFNGEVPNFIDKNKYELSNNYIN